MSKKLLFFHDGPRWKDKNGNQYGNSSDIDIYNRYKYFTDDVSFCMRVFYTENTSGLSNLNKHGLYINEITPFNRPSKLLNYFKSKKKITRLVKNADIIIVRLPSTIGSIAYWYAKKTNTPVIVEVVACPKDSLSNHSTLGRIYARFAVKKLLRITQDSEYTIYVTQNFLQNRYPSNGEVAAISDVIIKQNNGFNLKLNKYKGIDISLLNLGTLAVIDLEYKGHDLVLEAMSNLKKKGIDFNYIIAGKGDSKRLNDLAIKLGVRNNVVFLGLIDHSEIEIFFEKIDIYVQPSRVEGLPRAVVEAMSFGCACIGSSSGGIPELLDEEAIFNSGSVESLTHKLKYFNNSEILISQSQINFEKSKNYSFDSLEKKRKAFYDKFLMSIDEK